MANIIAAFLRHGHYHQPPRVPSAHLPHPLTEKGQQQAQQAVASLVEYAQRHDLHIAPTIHTSTLLRAWETTSILAKGLGDSLQQSFSIHQDIALAERGLGSAANLTLEEIDEIVSRDPRCPPTLPENWRATSDFRLPLPGAESLLEAGRRVYDYVEEHCVALQEHVQQDTMLIFVGHGGAFRHAATYMGLLALEELPRLSMHHCQPIFFERTPEGTWNHQGGAWKLRPSQEAAD